ncbi:hypothetical protein LLS1_11500 [Leifsonia sp. LS1]|uniref:hypothetical protein n=1 Tax=Leifsonia sp. LS1 TaxID=2828483 RepID=UPI001CFF4EF4|nr:hypothetical protein [Leifsonia sp. LS1]GIT79481.1 hypothetical protein LLS1_11500 [Leifsonia sp. LS1]
MDENQPTEPLPPQHPEPPRPQAETPAVAPAEPFYKRHGLAFAISTLVLGVVVLLGVVGAGTVVAVTVVSHSVSARDRSPQEGPRGPGDGRQDGGPGREGPGQGGPGAGGTQRELVRGTLESASGSEWSVTTAAGTTITVKITSSTAYGLPKQSMSASDFAPGDEVIVVGTDRSGDTVTAARILKLADIPRPGSTPGPTPGSGGL